MLLNRVFFIYMTAVGLAVGVVVTAWPEVREFRLPPYFWVLIAVAVFDGVTFLLWRNRPAAMITIDARLLGWLP